MHGVQPRLHALRSAAVAAISTLTPPGELVHAVVELAVDRAGACSRAPRASPARRLQRVRPPSIAGSALPGTRRAADDREPEVRRRVGDAEARAARPGMRLVEQRFEARRASRDACARSRGAIDDARASASSLSASSHGTPSHGRRSRATAPAPSPDARRLPIERDARVDALRRRLEHADQAAEEAVGPRLLALIDRRQVLHQRAAWIEHGERGEARQAGAGRGRQRDAQPEVPIANRTASRRTARCVSSADAALAVELADRAARPPAR